jgi:hypothetical protein
MHERATCRLPGLSGGHTLVELLVVLVLLAVSFTALAAGLGVGFRRAEARGAGQVWQAAALAAQLEQMGRGGRVVVDTSPRALAFVGESGHREALSLSPCFGSLATNVARWRKHPGVTVAFTGRHASPDGAGSLYLGSDPTLRLVVRVETGFTRREWHDEP